MSLGEAFEQMILGTEQDVCRAKIVKMAYALGLSVLVANATYVLSELSDGHVAVLLQVSVQPIVMFIMKVVGIIKSIMDSSRWWVMLIKAAFVAISFVPTFICILGPFVLVVARGARLGWATQAFPLFLAVNWMLVGMTVMSGR
jgi:hypothetical protein